MTNNAYANTSIYNQRSVRIFVCPKGLCGACKRKAGTLPCAGSRTAYMLVLLIILVIFFIFSFPEAAHQEEVCSYLQSRRPSASRPAGADTEMGTRAEGGGSSKTSNTGIRGGPTAQHEKQNSTTGEY